MWTLIDNYDSFTYNLYQALCKLGAEVRVVRNDVMTAAQAGEGSEGNYSFPWPGNAGGCRYLRRGGAAFCREAADLGRVLGTSDHWRGLWR